MDKPLCPCLVVIPLDYNPDENGVIHEVEPEVMVEIFSWFNRQFEGWRPVNPAGVGGIPPGRWRGQSDRSISVVTAIPSEQTDQFLRVVRAIGVKLRQKAMYYEIGPPIAGIMSIDDNAEPSTGG
jgi:hypothetical protein